MSVLDTISLLCRSLHYLHLNLYLYNFQGLQNFQLSFYQMIGKQKGDESFFGKMEWIPETNLGAGVENASSYIKHILAKEI